MRISVKSFAFIFIIFGCGSVQLFGETAHRNGTANAANFAAAVAPGSLATYFGTGLGPSTESATSTPLPTVLNGATLYINGIAAPLLYASPTQINFQVPYETVPGPATVVLSTAAQGNRPSETATVLPVALGIFRASGGYAVAQNQDYSVNGSSHAAKPGTVVVVYLTGIGQVTNPVATGYPASNSTLSYAAAQAVSAKIGNLPAQVLFAGLAPGFIGLAQVDLIVPNLPAGDFALSLTIGGSTEQVNQVAVGQTVSIPASSGKTPAVHIDSPSEGSLVSGAVTVSGWAINVDSPGDDPVTSVRVQTSVGAGGYATYGLPRPDACAAYPGRPNCPNVGFTYQLAIAPPNSRSAKITVLANDTSTPPLTGSSDVTVMLKVPVSISPNPADVPIGGSQLLYADRSVFWSSPAFGTIVVGGDPNSPITPNLPAGTALYRAPSKLTSAVDTLTATDSQDSTQKTAITIRLATVASLKISQTHAGNFTRGQTGVFTLVVSNQASASPTSGTVQVTEALPPDLVLSSISGAGWNCAGVACNRNDLLAPGSSYPPITIQVNVSPNAGSYQVPQATVSGGGSQSASATDPVSVL